MQKWIDFVNIFVNECRELFSSLDTQSQQLLLEDAFLKHIVTKPTQISVFNFQEPPQLLWIIRWNKNIEDLQVTVNENYPIKIETFSQEIKEKDPSLHEKLERIASHAYAFRESSSKFRAEEFPTIGADVGCINDSVYFLSKENFLEDDPKLRAKLEVERITDTSFFLRQTFRIFKKAREIEAYAQKALDKQLNVKLSATIRELNSSLTQLIELYSYGKKMAEMEGEMRGIRKLIGSSKEYQDWKVLIEDVDRHKKLPHIDKDYFKSEIKRLDQKIDGLKDIKFWSKRTILDIALASLATAATILSALLATGIIKF